MPDTYYRYWGKAKPGREGPECHLLPYHSLDVAAVAHSWWHASPVLRQRFTSVLHCFEQQAQAWILFFIALHDYGKLDIRFQRKAPKSLQRIRPDFDSEMIDLKRMEIKNYFHGPAGYSWFYQDFATIIGWNEYDEEQWDTWSPWLAAVTGHHGVIPMDTNHRHLLSTMQADNSILEHDRDARVGWVSDLEVLFLQPHGLSIQSSLPLCPPLLAGFCSICDWLGSRDSDDEFLYLHKPQGDLRNYFNDRLPIAERMISESGLFANNQVYRGIQPLLPKIDGVAPRQLQTQVDHFPTKPGLTLIEAPTGSGKTESALAYAWKLIDNGLAESIIFALPTQATANAMLERLEELAIKIFHNQPNLVLAHGKAKFNESFWKIRQNAGKTHAQGKEEASVQCANWLSASRKRSFLGQIGVCTVDQVLISVLPIRHQFVRRFGIGKSVLIIDEVHAYDQYMYRLLMSVLEQQKDAGGSAILLSATLPSAYRDQLLSAWGGKAAANNAYPLTTYCGLDGVIKTFSLSSSQMPKPFSVEVAVRQSPSLLPDSDLVNQIIDAATQGAQVAMICNLVDDAQQIYQRLSKQARVKIDLFHARYRFADRQSIEDRVRKWYGKEGTRTEGRIIVATQVIEQSLDLDFDWMITQLCPVDLLFQRLGRLHRHPRTRPEGFEQPRCTVLLPETQEYGYHELIYGDARLLWRTAEQLRQSGGNVRFPSAYRDWIEKVYQEKAWCGEPESFSQKHQDFKDKSKAAYYAALQWVNSHPGAFQDSDQNVALLTRDSEMSLNVLPITTTVNGRCLLDDALTPLTMLEEWRRDEVLSLNTVAVPSSWRKFLPRQKDGLIYLPMTSVGGQWNATLHGCTVNYHPETGMEKREQ